MSFRDPAALYSKFFVFFVLFMWFLLFFYGMIPSQLKSKAPEALERGKTMKRLLLMSTVLIGLLALPGLASANHFNDVIIMADCAGLNGQVGIHFGTQYTELDLHYEVTVTDVDGNVVETIIGDMVVTRGEDPDVIVMIAEEFNTLFDGTFVVSGSITISPYPDGYMEFETLIECGSVSTDNVSFENVKALYR